MAQSSIQLAPLTAPRWNSAVMRATNCLDLSQSCANRPLAGAEPYPLVKSKVLCISYKSVTRFLAHLAHSAKVSFCGTGSSVVVHPSVNNLFKHLLLWNSKAQTFDIWYVVSPSGLIPSLFKLWPLGKKWPHPGAYKFFIGKSYKIFLSETTKRRPFIVGM